jgi:ubiquitin-conjugating enzyme E2 variant
MTRLVKPYFAERTRRAHRIMLASVGANLVIMAFCVGYLLMEHLASGATWLQILAALLLGYFVADFASGVVHWAMDTWFDERLLGRVIAIAREHHTHPPNILGYDFLDHSALGSAPSAVVIGPLSVLTALFPVSVGTYSLMIVWATASTCLLFGTSFHNLAHRPARSRLLRLAQKAHLVITPKHHAAHHRSPQTIRYCVINGWANVLCDRLRVWRALEWLVHRLTGAEPRRDDEDWQHRFRRTGTVLRASSQMVER